MFSIILIFVLFAIFFVKRSYPEGNRVPQMLEELQEESGEKEEGADESALGNG